LDSESILAFLSGYNFYPGGELNANHMIGWLRKFAEDRAWNVAVVSRGKNLVGTVDMGPIGAINGLVRAPLKEPTAWANIKGLMTKGDAVVDLGEVAVSRANTGEHYETIRGNESVSNGLLVLYPISKGSRPVRTVEETSRRPLESPEDLIGVGIVFPRVLDGDVAQDGTFVAVRPDWAAEFDEVDEISEFQDTEKDFVAKSFSSDSHGDEPR
jgi:hypothetical protein